MMSDKLISSASLKVEGSILAGDEEQVNSSMGTTRCAASKGSTNGAVS
jgi:hypothetical protein